MPELVTVRHTMVEDAASIARVRAESWLGTYRGIVPDDFLDAIDLGEWTERQRRNMAEQPAYLVTLVAETEGLVVGWAVGGPNRDAAFDYAGEL